MDQGLGPGAAEDAERERSSRSGRAREKAAALEQLFRSRLSVLIGPAGTGKTTLLRMLCALPDVGAKGVLLLAPTGKARVRLEEQTGQRGAGRTLAQFLNGYQRYDGETGAYFPDRSAPRCGDFRTVIVDESLDAHRGPARGADRRAARTSSASCSSAIRGSSRRSARAGPFVDIVNELAPAGRRGRVPALRARATRS